MTFRTQSFCTSRTSKTLHSNGCGSPLSEVASPKRDEQTSAHLPTIGSLSRTHSGERMSVVPELCLRGLFLFRYDPPTVVHGRVRVGGNAQTEENA